MPRVRDPQTGRWRTLPPMVDPYPRRPGGPGWADDHEWDLATPYIGLDEDRKHLHGPNGWIADLAYDDIKGTADPVICNVSRSTGDVCRFPKGHEGPHVPFSGELISTTGIYVTRLP